MRKALGSAIHELRLRRKITQQQLADHLGVGKATVSRYESGEIDLPVHRLTELALLLGVETSALLRLAETGNLEDGPPLHGSVPLISWVQAGDWQDVIDHLQPGQGERIETSYRAKAHTYALRVRGDSMEPKFPEGCIIIVEPEEAAAPGKYVVVRDNGEATFKQLIADGGRLYLRPLNPRYPLLELSKDAVFCGVVKRVEMDV